MFLCAVPRYYKYSLPNTVFLMCTNTTLPYQILCYSALALQPSFTRCYVFWCMQCRSNTTSLFSYVLCLSCQQPLTRYCFQCLVIQPSLTRYCVFLHAHCLSNTITPYQMCCFLCIQCPSCIHPLPDTFFVYTVPE